MTSTRHEKDPEEGVDGQQNPLPTSAQINTTEEHLNPKSHDQQKEHDRGADDNESIHTINTSEWRPVPLTHNSTHLSHSHDAPIQHFSSYTEVPDEVYDRLPHHRKVVIVTLLSFCSFLAPISSTTILAAVPEVAETYHTTGTIVNLSNALYMLFMGISPCFWGPLSQVFGRRHVRSSYYSITFSK